MAGRDPYEVLGVERDASDDAIRDAYFRLVRTHSPEDAPDRFQAISDAYAVLSDPEQRKTLDDALGFPADVADALRQAEALREREPDRAVQVALALLRVPRPPAVRWAVAMLCLGASRPADAVPLLEALVQLDPKSADFEHALGDALLRAGRADAAARHLRAAVALDPTRRGAYLSLAELHEAAGATDLALKTLREALPTGRSGGARVGLADLGVLLRMFTVLANAGRFQELDRVLAAVRAVVPEGDADAARHVASRLASLSDRFAEARRYQAAHVLMAAADGIFTSPAAKQRAAQLAAFAAAQRQADAAARDAAVPAWIQSILVAYFGGAITSEAYDRLVARLADELSRRLRESDAEWTKFERRYAAAAAHVAEARTAARNAANTLARKPSRGRTPRAEPAQISPMVRFVAIAAFAVIMGVVRTGCNNRPSPSRDSWKTLIEQSPYQPRTEQELRSAMESAEILRAAAARKGRALTVDEMVEAVREAKNAPKPVVIDEPIRLDPVPPREGSTTR